MYFKLAFRDENSTKCAVDDLCVNLVCEYVCWILVALNFFPGRSLPFLILSIILKNKKICTLELLIISHVLVAYGRIGTWIQANSTRFNDIRSKDLSNRPIYAVLNTHNLDIILQLKYMPIVMNPARFA